MPDSLRKNINRLKLFQGVYFIATGAWPIFDIYTFMLITGYKHDEWLVKTCGLLIFSIGSVLLLSCLLKEFSLALMLLGFLSALMLFGIDVYYSSRHVIDKIYMADAILELIIIAGWSIFLIKALPSLYKAY